MGKKTAKKIKKNKRLKRGRGVARSKKRARPKKGINANSRLKTKSSKHSKKKKVVKKTSKAKANPVKAKEVKSPKIKKAKEPIYSKVPAPTPNKQIKEAKQTEVEVKKREEFPLASKDKDSDLCMVEGCEENKTSGDFCRFHYIAKWKRLKKKERVLAEKRLNKYIEELTSRYPDEYLEVIKRDLLTDKNFGEVLQDLEIEDIDDFVGVDEGDDDIIGKKFGREEDEEF